MTKKPDRQKENYITKMLYRMSSATLEDLARDTLSKMTLAELKEFYPVDEEE